MADTEAVSTEIIARERTKHSEIIIHADTDRLQAWLSCDELPGSLSLAALHEMLDRLEITFGIRREGLDEVLKLAAEDLPAQMILIAEGIEPVPGTDAKLVFTHQPIGTRKAPTKEDEQIDYRESRSIDNVQEGDLVATYRAAVEGQGGTDILNKALPTPKVQELEIKVGENIRFDLEANQYFATCSGCVLFAADALSVSSTYEVRGSVSLAHGNIRFIGSVAVSEDVPDDFAVEAAEGITIGGTAEACVLRSGRDVIIRGGVTGKGKGKIDAKGNVVARFLNEVEVTCSGDVIVLNEIINARVYTLGRVIVKRGAIVGGEIIALKGILVQDVGSELGVKTTLVAGIDYTLRVEILGVNRELASLLTRQQGMLNQIATQIERARKMPAVDTRLRGEIKEQWGMIRTQQKRLEELEINSGTLSASFVKKAISVITITRDLYASVVTVVGKYERESTSQVRGPLTVSANSDFQHAELETGEQINTRWERAGYPPLRGGDA